MTLLMLLCTLCADQASPHKQLLDRFLAPEETPLVSYQAVRRLSASTRGGKTRADMEVLTVFDPERGFRFTVLSESGSGLIRRKVLLAALEAEQKIVSKAARDESALTPANYEFQPLEPTVEAPAAIGVRARRKSVTLVNGTLFVHPERADLERVEGELADRPSFWTKRVRINRRYERIDGVHVPVLMESIADVRVVGASTFTMAYRYTEINGRKVPPTP